VPRPVNRKKMAFPPQIFGVSGAPFGGRGTCFKQASAGRL
jgi:hypothetical protein